MSAPSGLHTNYCSGPSLQPASFQENPVLNPSPPFRVPRSRALGLLKALAGVSGDITVGELRQSSHTAGANFKYTRQQWNLYHQNILEGGGKKLSIWGLKGNTWEQ